MMSGRAKVGRPAIVGLAFGLCVGPLVLAPADQPAPKPILTLRNANHPTISADGSRIAVGPECGVVEVYQVSPKRKLRTFRPGGCRQWLSSDGQTLVVNGDRLRLLDVDSGQQLAEIDSMGIEGPEIWWLEEGAPFSSDLRIVGDSLDLLKREGETTPGVALWDLENRKLIRTFGEDRYIKDHWGKVFLSADGRLVAASRWNVDRPERAMTAVWEVETRRELLRLPFQCFWLAISADGRRLVTEHRVSGGGESLTFSVTEKGELRVERTPGAPQPAEPSVYHTEVWEIETGKQVSLIGGGKDTPFNRAGAGALSPDGKLLATGSLGYVVLWNAETGELLTSLPHEGRIPPREAVRSIAFSGDGRFLVTDSTPTEVVKVWRVGDLLALPAVEPRE